MGNKMSDKIGPKCYGPQCADSLVKGETRGRRMLEGREEEQPLIRLEGDVFGSITLTLHHTRYRVHNNNFVQKMHRLRHAKFV